MTRKRWRKSWEEKWRDEASDLLGLAAKAMRALLGDVAELEDGSSVGWAVDGSGRPYTRTRLARLLSATDEQAREAVEQLVAAGVAVEVDGRLGLVGWRETQEDPAKRVRRYRAADGGEHRGRAVVYFLQAGDDGPVKIGFTKNLGTRIEDLQCGRSERLRLIGHRPGGRQEEKALHLRLAAHRLRGEWFKPSAEVLAAASGTEEE